MRQEDRAISETSSATPQSQPAVSAVQQWMAVVGHRDIHHRRDHIRPHPSAVVDRHRSGPQSRHGRTHCDQSMPGSAQAALWGLPCCLVTSPQTLAGWIDAGAGVRHDA